MGKIPSFGGMVSPSAALVGFNVNEVEYLTNLRDESWTRARGRYLEADLLRDPGELRM